MLDHNKKLFLLERACEFGHMDLGDLIAMCQNAQAQFFETDNGVTITCVVQSGLNRLLYVMAMGANEEGVKELREVVVQYALENNCQYVQTKGRFGFEKARPKRYSDAMEGFEPVGVLYELNLKDNGNVKQTSSTSRYPADPTS